MNILSSIILAGVLAFNVPSTAVYKAPEPPKVEYYVPTHSEETFIRALEYCESRGVVTAINPKDSDGTPSYYSWQFKPTTFAYYLKKYDIPEAPISDYKTQYLILSQMVHDKDVKWSHEFPACSRLLGNPPKE